MDKRLAITVKLTPKEEEAMEWLIKAKNQQSLAKRANIIHSLHKNKPFRRALNSMWRKGILEAEWQMHGDGYIPHYKLPEETLQAYAEGGRNITYHLSSEEKKVLDATLSLWERGKLTKITKDAGPYQAHNSFYRYQKHQKNPDPKDARKFAEIEEKVKSRSKGRMAVDAEDIARATGLRTSIVRGHLQRLASRGFLINFKNRTLRNEEGEIANAIDVLPRPPNEYEARDKIAEQLGMDWRDLYKKPMPAAKSRKLNEARFTYERPAYVPDSADILDEEIRKPLSEALLREAVDSLNENYKMNKERPRYSAKRGKLVFPSSWSRQERESYEGEVLFKTHKILEQRYPMEETNIHTKDLGEFDRIMNEWLAKKHERDAKHEAPILKEVKKKYEREIRAEDKTPTVDFAGKSVKFSRAWPKEWRERYQERLDRSIHNHREQFEKQIEELVETPAKTLSRIAYRELAKGQRIGARLPGRREQWVRKVLKRPKR